MNTCWQKTVSKTCWSIKTKEEDEENQIDLSGYPNHNQRLKFDPALDNRFGLRGLLNQKLETGFDAVWSEEQCPLAAVLFETF